MLNPVVAVVRNGKIELPPEAPLVEGTRVLVTFLPADDEKQFWMAASQSSLDPIWDNPQDDAYAELLKK
jgi:hypothetical protein